MADDAHWMERAFSANKGGLHRATGIPAGGKIPASKMQKAAHSKDSHVRHMEQAAANAAGTGRKRKYFGQ